MARPCPLEQASSAGFGMHLTKPRALGMTITVFNLEVLHLPGDDAAVLKAATDA
jgi:hypothetical protein